MKEFFDKVERLPLESKNELFIGFRGNSKYFIKKYVVRKGRKEEDLNKIKREIVCYNHLKLIQLPKLIKASFKQRYLILEFVEFKNVEPSKLIVDKILDFYFTEIITIDPSFLPKVDFEYYEKSLFKSARQLVELEFIRSLKPLIKRLEANKKMINDASKYFSHGDLHLGNFKFLSGELTITDFEHSRQDNLMYDLASLYIDLYHDKLLAEYFLKKINTNQIFDELLFNLMIDRRCIEVLFGLQLNQDIQQFRNAKTILRK